MRKNVTGKKKEDNFTTSHHVNDILLPTYNALKDPYLAGYFDNPAIKKHLKETGVIKKKKKYHFQPNNNEQFLEGVIAFQRQAPSRKKSRRCKSFSKSVNHNGIKLPEIDQERGGLSSAATTRVKRIYHSKESQQQR